MYESGFWEVKEDPSPNIVSGWEKYRLAFNIVVFFAGLPAFPFLLSRPGDEGIFYIIGVTAYGIIANVSFCAGWVFESFFNYLDDEWHFSFGARQAFAITGIVLSAAFTFFIAIAIHFLGIWSTGPF